MISAGFGKILPNLFVGFLNCWLFEIFGRFVVVGVFVAAS